MWYFLIGVLAGFIIGILPSIFNAIYKEKPVGNLVVDRSDKDGPLLFLELNTSLPSVEEQEEVSLKVVHKNYLDTQE